MRVNVRTNNRGNSLSVEVQEYEQSSVAARKKVIKTGTARRFLIISTFWYPKKVYLACKTLKTLSSLFPSRFLLLAKRLLVAFLTKCFLGVPCGLDSQKSSSWS